MRRPGKMTLPILLLLLLASPLLGNGGKGKKTRYLGEVEKRTGLIMLSSELEKILFLLNSVEGKYKVIRVKIDNQSQEDLRLSGEKDKVDIHFGGRVVSGILRLSESDPDLWDSFDDELRRVLAYPLLVEAEEEENIFVFIPAEDVDELPRFLTYTINSLSDRPVRLNDDTPVARV